MLLRAEEERGRRAPAQSQGRPSRPVGSADHLSASSCEPRFLMFLFFLSNNFMMPHRAVSKVLTPLQTSESDSSVSSRASCLPVDEPTAAGQQSSCSVWGRPLHFPTRCSPDKLLHFCPLSFTHFLQPIWLNSIWICTDFYPVANITLLPLTFIDASQWIYLNTSVYTPGNWIYTYRLRLSINQTEEIFYEKQRTRYWWNEGQNDLLSLN